MSNSSGNKISGTKGNDALTGTTRDDVINGNAGVEHIRFDTMHVEMNFVAFPQPNLELLVNVVAGAETLHFPPAEGGPTTSERTFITATLTDVEAGLILFTGAGDADITEVFGRGQGGHTARVSGTIPFFNELLVEVPMAIDFTVQATERPTHGVSHEKFTSAELSINTHLNGWHTPAAAEGSMTYEGVTYLLSTAAAEFVAAKGGVHIKSSDAEGTDWMF